MLAQPALAQSGPRLVASAAVNNFPAGLRFELSAESDQPLTRAILRYGAEGRTCLASAAQQSVDFDPATAIEIGWEWDFTRTGVLPPGVGYWWQWELEDASGARLLTERQSGTLSDPRYDWQVAARGGVTVTWTEGSQAFGQSLLDLSLASLDRLEQDLGVRPDGPVALLIYPNTDQLTEAFVSLPEWTGGVALPAYNVIVTAIEPGQNAWAASVLPHELAHLVVGARVFNCRGVGLPTWLNEGLAVVAEGPAVPDDAARVQQALAAGRLPTLRSLANGFQAEAGRANLAYAQSAEVVRFLIGQHGAGRLNALLDLVQQGQSIDPAFRAVYGFDTDGLDSAWRVAQGAPPLPTAAPTLPPAERTPVPTLALWTAAPLTMVAATGQPVTPAATVAAATVVAAAQATATPPAVAQRVTSTPPGPASPLTVAGGGPLLMASLACGGLALALVLLVVFRRRR